MRSNPLFTYAVIADTHLNQGEDECNSPFEVNRLANARLRYIVDDLNSRSLSHVIHLGDIVHPVPSMGQLYTDSANNFHDEVKGLEHPLFLIPGNHDVGDKPIEWGPAGTVRQSFLDAWSDAFGDHYFKHVYEGVVFIGINAQVLGSDLPLEQEQNDWLLESLKTHQSDRICLFTHYPPFLYDPTEEEHYDNLSHDSRARLLTLIEQYDIEVLFAGHVHHFWFNRYQNCDCYLLPSTCFTRQDYSEMFRIGPAAEHGRNDSDKLGYLLVHVFEDSQQIEMVRSYGTQQSEDDQLVGLCEFWQSAAPVNALTNPFPILGFDLRQDWCEKVQIPPSGGLDEFARKWVRNDYGLLALWEMGVKFLRIPSQDLADPERVNRVADLGRLGFKFSLYSYGQPDQKLVSVVEENAEFIESWEIGFRTDNVRLFDNSVFAICKQKGIRLLASPLRSKSDIVSSGKAYYHVINHGFLASDNYTEESNFSQITDVGVFDGIVVRCGVDDLIDQALKVSEITNANAGLTTQIYLRITADSPAIPQNDEVILCKRIAEAMISVWGQGYNVRVYCDSFTENDRGYFPRVGVLDRRFNPRAGFHLVKVLHELFACLGDATGYQHSELNGDGMQINVETKRGQVMLLLPYPGNTISDSVVKKAKDSGLQQVKWLRNYNESTTAQQSNPFPMLFLRRY